MTNFSLSRSPNTDQNGRYFSEQQKLAVWQKAATAPNRESAEWRLDICGALIHWSDFGTTTANGNGWEIDHIIPVARGGSDDLSNLQALQWQNNRHKSDSLSSNYCLISLQ